MREIKFRAWDTKSSVMRNVVHLQFTVAGNHSKDGIKFAQMLGGIQRRGENVDLMQFTGLLDKNGVEIYEGDIIESKLDRHKWRYVVVREEKNCNLEAKTVWRNFYYDSENEEYIFEDKFDSQGGTSLNGLINCTIIGNIYENKELLDEIRE